MRSIEVFLKNVSNKKLLVVYPHPDDESVMAGGLMLKAMRLGYEVTVLTLTEGGRGKIYVSGKGRSLSEIRREEMAHAMSTLGVADWVMWKFDDGRLKKTIKWRERLADFINATRPGVVVTYDPSGTTGHPDHIAQSIEVLRIYKKTKNFKLIWTSFAGATVNKMVNKKVVRYLQNPVYYLDLSPSEGVKKWRAVFKHKSQNLGSYVGRPWWKLVLTMKREWYSEASSQRKYKYRFVPFKI